MKQDRIELRASEAERSRLLEAAGYSGMTLSSFLRQAALEKSDDVLKHRDIVTLADADRDSFLDAIESPSKPNKHLQQAFKKYHKLKSESLTPKPITKKPASRVRRAKAVIHKVR